MCSSNPSQLFDAIDAGDIERLRRLIAEGVDVNAMRTDTTDSDKMAALANMPAENMARAMGATEKDLRRINEDMQSMPKEQADAMLAWHQNIMKMAAQFTRSMESPKTALMAAAAKGRADMLVALLDAGAPVNAAAPSGVEKGETALMLAAASGSAEAVQLLLSRGANVHAALKAGNERGKTALMYAAEQGHAEAAQALIASGAKINAKDSDGKTALDWAIENGQVDVADVLEAHGAENGTRPSNPLFAYTDDETPLMSAARNGHLAMVRRLVERGADVNEREKDSKKMALDYAAENGHADVVAYLLAHGADAKAKTEDGGTALHSAAMEGCAEVVKLLLDAGADADAREDDGSPDGTSPLHWAAACGGSAETVRLLLEAGANPNAVGDMQRNTTPLISAIAEERIEIVKLLLEAGADPNLEVFELDEETGEKYEEMTPMDMAKSCNNEEIIALLKAAGARE